MSKLKISTNLYYTIILLKFQTNTNLKQTKMKATYTKALFLIMLTSLFFTGCQKENDDNGNSTQQTLTKKTLIGNDVILPSGTKWKYSNKNYNEVSFELNEDYIFLLRNIKTDEFIISRIGGGYSCSCSGGGGCTTFYTDETGYGCLQSKCKGTCTEKATSITSGFIIVGVLNAKNNSVNAKNKFDLASLSDEGKKGFFKVPEIQNEIKKTYDLIYKHSIKPNFNDDISKMDSEKYIMAKVSFYGFEIGLIVPNDSNIKKMMPEIEITPLLVAPKSCKCTGGTGCKLTKDCLFGYCAYYCSGCTTCTMYTS